MTDFDPYEQNVTFSYDDGTPFSVPISDIDDYVQNGVQTSIIYSSQLGASIVTFVILLLLTKSDKRRSMVFALNTTALVLNIARLVCEVLYFTSDFFKAYQFFAGDYTEVPGKDYATSILGLIFTFFLLICIEISLVMQTLVICANLRHWYKRIILWASIMIALVPIGFRLGMLVENAKFIVANEDFTPFIWLQSANTILLTISVCFFCSIFAVKLGYAIRKRKQLGIKSFGPMQVIFIMSCQTMIVPAIFSILQYVTDVPEISSNIYTLIAISLPLSSLWAAASLHDTGNSSTGTGSSGRKLWSVLSSGSVAASKKSPVPQFGRSSSALVPHVDHMELLQEDLERGSPGITVNRSFRVDTSKKVSTGSSNQGSLRQGPWKPV